MGSLRIALLTVALLSVGPADVRGATLASGGLSVELSVDPWRLVFTDASDGDALRESSRRDAGRSGPLGVQTASGWDRALRAETIEASAARLRARVVTAAGRILLVDVEPAGEGVLALEAAPASPDASVQAIGIGFEAPDAERHFGFGSRSNAVDQRGREVESYVSDGPFRPEDRAFVKAFVPPWADRDRDDATYYPVPWWLSSRGLGVLVDRDEPGRFRLGVDRADEWGVEVDGASLALRVFAGPKPADALRRFTAATGRQPPPPTEWTFGPWFQTGQPNVVALDEEAAIIKALRDADAPVSAAETQMHFLPCGAHRADPEYNRARTAQFHAAGLAHMVYLNPSLCTSYADVWQAASQAGVLQRERTGAPHAYPAFVGGAAPLGFSTEPLSHFDFTAPGAEAFYGRLVQEVIDGGHDGWMEDFGESTPPTIVAADGTSGVALHNRYPRDYHCTVDRIARRAPRPIVRFQRSGWTGAAACAVNVWGGDPTTVFGFDGLESVVRQALSIGMSGVSRFGSDIGGYNTFGPMENLDRELLNRWIELGAVSGVMRTKRSGLAFPSYDRPQVFDPEHLPVWRRYAKLHTQLHPYLLAADAAYRRTGLPFMRHLGLIHPDDRVALAVEDQFYAGPDLIAAPVLREGAREREAYLPAGEWLDWWRSVGYDERDGAFRIGAARRLTGGRRVTLPAPEDELPLAVRAGAVLALLGADVDTLAPYRAAGVVGIADRRDRLTLLAWPRGRSRSAFNERERLDSVERRGRWVLRVTGARTRTYSIQASLATLRRPLRPCRATVRGRPVRLRYDRATRVVSLRARLRSGAVVVRACRGRAR